jgi:hypothetical protein
MHDQPATSTARHDPNRCAVMRLQPSLRVMMPTQAPEADMPVRVLAAIILICASLDGARAQPSGMPQLSAGELAEASAACAQLASMPNAPMSVASCQAMLGMASRMGAVANDPSARRPGDDSMSCAAIFAELRTMAGVGISEANAARNQAALDESKALGKRQAAETGAFIAETYALGAVAGVVGAFTPNFVGAAIAAAWQAQAVALGTRQMAEQAPVRARATEAMTASMDELTRSMEANPRFARLGQLAADKRCEPPPGTGR